MLAEPPTNNNIKFADKPYIITGTGTGVGKTYITAQLLRQYGGDYFKPIQTGAELDNQAIAKLCPDVYIHDNIYQLAMPAAPHVAAMAANTIIDIDKINHAINKLAKLTFIEGAGGLCVPLTHNMLLLDLFAQLRVEVILVSLDQLGMLNHTLLSIDALQQRGIKIKAVIINQLEVNNLDNAEVLRGYTDANIMLYHNDYNEGFI